MDNLRTFTQSLTFRYALSTLLFLAGLRFVLQTEHALIGGILLGDGVARAWDAVDEHRRRNAAQQIADLRARLQKQIPTES